MNLRQSFYNKDVLRKSFEYADIVKLNEHELIQVSSLFELGTGTAEFLARRLLQDFDLKLVCITRADRGSLLVSREQTVEHGRIPGQGGRCCWRWGRIHGMSCTSLCSRKSIAANQ